MADINKQREWWNFFGLVKPTVERKRRVARFVPQTVENVAATTFTLHPLTLAQLDELWRLDQRCFVNGEAYTRHTLEYLLSAANNLSYRAVAPNGTMLGFIISMHEADGTGHITTIGVAPEQRRRGIGEKLLEKCENAFHRREVRLMRLEVRTVNTAAQKLYIRAGYAVVQRLPRYYANGGDGLMMVKSLVE